ncbi:MAG: hypothetical protein GXY75_03355 [Bacteroidales bacterium]|jgi:hypothetical protein|nr:hypothetical protein [Bacteroidales bacterium]
MKRIIFVIALVIISFNANAQSKIVYTKDGSTLRVRFQTQTDSITLHTIEKDFIEMFNIANKLNCKAIMLYENNGLPYMTIYGKREIKLVNKWLEILKAQINEMSKTEYIKGDAVKSWKVRKSGPKYVSETYLNGKLQNRFESDWDMGYFKPTTSTYTSGSQTYVTKTFFQPEQYETKYQYGPGKTVINSGVKAIVNRVYLKTQ